MHKVDLYFYAVALLAFAKGAPLFFQLASIESLGIARSAGKQIDDCGLWCAVGFFCIQVTKFRCFFDKMRSLRGVLFALIASVYLSYNLYEENGGAAPAWIDSDYFLALLGSEALLIVVGVVSIVVGRLSGGEDEEEKEKAE